MKRARYSTPLIEVYSAAVRNILLRQSSDSRSLQREEETVCAGLLLSRAVARAGAIVHSYVATGDDAAGRAIATDLNRSVAGTTALTYSGPTAAVIRVDDRTYRSPVGEFQVPTRRSVRGLQPTVIFGGLGLRNRRASERLAQRGAVSVWLPDDDELSDDSLVRSVVRPSCRMVLTCQQLQNLTEQPELAVGICMLREKYGADCSFVICGDSLTIGWINDYWTADPGGSADRVEVAARLAITEEIRQEDNASALSRKGSVDSQPHPAEKERLILRSSESRNPVRWKLLATAAASGLVAAAIAGMR